MSRPEVYFSLRTPLHYETAALHLFFLFTLIGGTITQIGRLFQVLGNLSASETLKSALLPVNLGVARLGSRTITVPGRCLRLVCLAYVYLHDGHPQPIGSSACSVQGRVCPAQAGGPLPGGYPALVLQCGGWPVRAVLLRWLRGQRQPLRDQAGLRAGLPRQGRCVAIFSADLGVVWIIIAVAFVAIFVIIATVSIFVEGNSFNCAHKDVRKS